MQVKRFMASIPLKILPFSVLMGMKLGVVSPVFGGGDEISLTDATGEKLVFHRPPSRIVSLNPDFTDTLFALGAGEDVVGTTDFCLHPDTHPGIERCGNLWSPDLEKVVSLNPDIIFATMAGNNPGTVESLRNLEIPVFVAGPQVSFSAYFRLLRRLGVILKREEEAARLIGSFRDEIRELSSRTGKEPPVDVFIQLGAKPLVTASGGTMVDELIRVAGGRNVAASLPGRYPVMSREQVLVSDPEVIIISTMGSDAPQSRNSWSCFTGLRAVREGRIHQISSDTICRLGPRLREGLREMALLLHPDIFSGSDHLPEEGTPAAGKTP